MKQLNINIQLFHYFFSINYSKHNTVIVLILNELLILNTSAKKFIALSMNIFVFLKKELLFGSSSFFLPVFYKSYNNPYDICFLIYSIDFV